MLSPLTTCCAFRDRRIFLVLDGTWPQAKEILAASPQLQALPCARLEHSKVMDAHALDLDIIPFYDVFTAFPSISLSLPLLYQSFYLLEIIFYYYYFIIF